MRFMLLIILLFQVLHGNAQAQASAELMLITAAQQGELQKVKDLLLAGADVNAKNSAGKTALMGAAYHGNRRVVDWLLAQGADVGIKDNNDSTAIIDAVYSGNEHIVKTLIARGAQPHQETKAGNSAQKVASAKGYTHIQSILDTVPKPEAAEEGEGDAKDKDKKKSKTGKKK